MAETRKEVEKEMYSGIEQKGCWTILIDSTEYWRSFPKLAEVSSHHTEFEKIAAEFDCLSVELRERMDHIAKQGEIVDPEKAPWLVVIDSPQYLPQELAWYKLICSIRANSPECKLSVIVFDDRPDGSRWALSNSDLI